MVIREGLADEKTFEQKERRGVSSLIPGARASQREEGPEAGEYSQGSRNSRSLVCLEQ